MIKDIELKHAKFVISKNDYCYKEVIEDFENATKVGIVTYNISKREDDFLIKALSKLPEEAKVQIITNIPTRFDSYFNDKVKYNANKTIMTYIDMYLCQENGQYSYVIF